MRRSIIAALALAASALAVPALAADSLGTKNRSHIVAKAGIVDSVALNSNIDQVAIATSVSSDFESVAPFFAAKTPMPMLQYAVLVRMSADSFGANSGLGARNVLQIT